MSDFKVAAVSSAAAGNTIKEAGPDRICVLGVGGGGGNALQYMINQSLGGVEFIAVNTDSVALGRCTAPTRVQIGVTLTHGLGAGCNPSIGRKAAEESHDQLKELLQGVKMVFITAGMGGGTGTGAAPLIAQIAKEECGALTVAVVTKPFKFEGRAHSVNAQAGITELSKHVDSILVIDNNKLLSSLGANVSIITAFNACNDVLYRAVYGITSMIFNSDYMNVDFNDISMVMKNRGQAVIGIGHGKGPTFVDDALTQAVRNPLLEDTDIQSATNLLVHTRVNSNFPIDKWNDLQSAVRKFVGEGDDDGSKIGLSFDDSLAEDEIYITIILTGISAAPAAMPEAAVARAQAAQRRQGNPLPAGGFFSMAQERQPGTLGQPHPAAAAARSAASAQVQEVPAAQAQPEPHVPGGFFAAGPAAPAPFAAPQPAAAPAEVPTENKLVDERGDMWEIPPLLRSRPD